MTQQPHPYAQAVPQHPLGPDEYAETMGHIQPVGAAPPVQPSAVAPAQAQTMPTGMEAVLATMQSEINGLKVQNAQLATRAAMPAPDHGPAEPLEVRIKREEVEAAMHNNEQVRRLAAHCERMRDELIEYERQLAVLHIIEVEKIRKELWDMTEGKRIHGQTRDRDTGRGPAGGGDAGAARDDAPAGGTRRDDGRPEAPGEHGARVPQQPDQRDGDGRDGDGGRGPATDAKSDGHREGDDEREVVAG